MWRYVVRRLIQSILVIFSMSFISYSLMGLMPGDPVKEMRMSNPQMTDEDEKLLRKQLGLDRPVVERYVEWAGSAITGDFGDSSVYKVPVSSLIGERLVNTFIYTFSSLLLAVLVAVPIGILVAFRKGNAFFDYLINFLGYLGFSTPVFWMGMVLILIFSVQLGVLPFAGTYTITDESMTLTETIADRAKYLILPIAAFTMSQIPTIMRYTRGAVLDVLNKDYVRTAKAKGIPQHVITRDHVLRNALIPIITIVALLMATLFDGAVISEQVFAYQGVGKLLFDSITSKDFNVAMVSFMITIIMVQLMNLLADLLYAFADPRIQYE